MGAPLFGDFPFELIEMIFDFLDLSEVLKFRRVSKKFKAIVNEFKLRDLVFVDNPEFEKSFQFTNKPINFRHLIISKADLSFLAGPSMNLQRLKQLKVCCTANNYNISLSDLNRLTQLEYLELSLFIFIKSGEQDRIILPNLQTLVIGRSWNIIEFETPKLLQLDDRGSMSMFVFKHPLSVEHLKTDLYKPQYSVFKNLKKLDCRGSFDNSALNETILATYPNLQALSVKSCEDLYSLNCLLKKKRILGRLDLKIHYRGVQLSGNNELSYNDLVYADALTYQIENYGALKESLSWITEINYNDLMNLVKGRIPGDFFVRFNNIQRVRVRRPVEDAEYLLGFVGNCTNLNRLIIDHGQLKQSFYDRIDARCRTLVSLEIFEDHEVDLSFLHRLPYLKQMRTDQELDANSVLLVFERLKYLENVEYKLDSATIRIDQYRANTYNTYNAHYSLTNGSGRANTYRYNLSAAELIASLDELLAERIAWTRSFPSSNKFQMI